MLIDLIVALITLPIRIPLFFLTIEKRNINTKKIKERKEKEIKNLNSELEIFNKKTKESEDLIVIDNVRRLIENSIVRLKKESFDFKIINPMNYFNQELNLKRLNHMVIQINKTIDEEVDNLKNLKKYYFKAQEVKDKLVLMKNDMNDQVYKIEKSDNKYILEDMKKYVTILENDIDSLENLPFSLSENDLHKIDIAYLKSLSVYNKFLDKSGSLNDMKEKIEKHLQWCEKEEIELIKKWRKDKTLTSYHKMSLYLREAITNLNDYKLELNYVDALYEYEKIRKKYDRVILE